MKYLLDTHVMLWALIEPDKLGESALAALESATVIYVSAASIWEARIKANIGKLSLPEPLVSLVDRSGFTELPVDWEMADKIGEADLPHHDPFDRLLLTQAGQSQLTFVTADETLLAAQPMICLDARK